MINQCRFKKEVFFGVRSSAHFLLKIFGTSKKGCGSFPSVCPGVLLFIWAPYQKQRCLCNATPHATTHRRTYAPHRCRYSCWAAYVCSVFGKPASKANGFWVCSSGLIFGRRRRRKRKKEPKKVIITITTYIYYIYHITVTHTVFGCQQQAKGSIRSMWLARATIVNIHIRTSSQLAYLCALIVKEKTVAQSRT